MRSGCFPSRLLINEGDDFAEELVGEIEEPSSSTRGKRWWIVGGLDPGECGEAEQSATQALALSSRRVTVPIRRSTYPPIFLDSFFGGGLGADASFSLSELESMTVGGVAGWTASGRDHRERNQKSAVKRA